MATRRFIVPNSSNVRYANFYYDPYVAKGWVWVGTFEKPASTSRQQNMAGFEGFSEDWAGSGGMRDIDIRNVWMLDLNNNWRNVTSAHMDDNRDNGQLFPIAGGWRHHSYDPNAVFNGSNNIPMLADSSVAPLYIPYLINAGGNVIASIRTEDQVASTVGRAFEPDAYWSGSSNDIATSASINVAGVANVAPARLYQTARQGANFSYTLFGLKPNTATTIRLHFSEPTYNSVGTRKQKVTINGNVVEVSLDIRAAAAAINKALVRSYTATPGADGKITINLSGLTSVPAIISGIEAGTIAVGGGGSGFTPGTYRLIPKMAPGSALDDPAGNTADGTPFSIWTWHGGNNQKINVIDVGGGYYKLQLANDASKVVDVSGADSADGTAIQVWADIGSTAQKWKLVDAGGGYYKLQPQCAPNSALDVTGAATSDGARVILWTAHGGDNQLWKLERQ
jgi:Ricin-type beta-trefoil lectin domain-like/Malectin domain